MAKETENLFKQAKEIMGRKLTSTEQIVLNFFSQKRQVSSGEDMFMELYNTGISVSYPTVYVTLRRLAGIGVLHKEYDPKIRRVFYSLHDDSQHE